MGMRMGIRCRSLGKILKQILRAYHRQLCTNIVGFVFLNMWTYIEGSCIIYVIIMKVFGSRPKLVIIGKLCELTHFLSWWQSVVFKESGFGVIRSGCLGLPFTVYEHLVSYLWPQFLNPQNGIAVCVQQVSYENSVKLSVVSLTHCVTHRRGWIGVSTLYSNAKGKLHSGRRGVCSQNIDRREILQRMQLYF